MGSNPTAPTICGIIEKMSPSSIGRTVAFHATKRSSTLLGDAIRRLDSSIGRAADSRRLVSKENAGNGGGRAIRPAASIICGFRDRGPVEVPFKITV